MKDLFTKTMSGALYVILGVVIGYLLAGRCSRENTVDQGMKELKKEFSQYVDKMSKQTQEFEERLKEYLSKNPANSKELK